MTVCRILIVEDDPSWRYTTSKLLVDAGFEVVSASTAADAIQMLGQEPDLTLLLTDIVLPHGESGYTVGRIASKIQPGLKILYMTGYHVPIDLQDKVMSKSVGSQELIRWITRVLDSSDASFGTGAGPTPFATKPSDTHPSGR